MTFDEYWDEKGQFGVSPEDVGKLAWDAATANCEAALKERDARIAELGEQLEFDRTAVAASMTAANRAIDMRHWLTEGRGPYEWNDDNWHKEFYAAAIEIKAALEPLTKIAANWSGCPMKGEEVATARIDLKKRVRDAEAALAERTAERDAAREDTARLDWLCADIFNRKVYVRDYDDDTGKYTYICCGQRADTPRAAIDAARAKQEGK